MENAREEYRALVRKIGWGFHPDTCGGDYIALPADVTADEVDRIVLVAIFEGVDVYAEALDVLEESASHCDCGGATCRITAGAQS